jgi:putative ABC transport system permease protein
MVQLRRVTSLRTTPDLPKPLPPLPPPGSTSVDNPDTRLVSRDYVKVMGMRMVSGRGFDENDRADRPRVLLINRTLARRRFPGENPIGKTIYSIGREPWEIVGVVEDVRQFGLDRDPEPQVFADFRQWPLPPVAAGPVPIVDAPSYYAVRTDREPTSLVSSVGSIVRQLDAQATLDNVATMEQLVSNSISRPRMYAVLLGIFAGVAAGLAAIGIYGVMAYSVTQRAREFGIRMALGAERSDVMKLVLGQSLVLTAVGIVLGLAGAAAVTRYLQGMLFGLTPLDPTTFIAVSLMFGLIATLAAYVPARRATRVDPVVALRCE